MAYRILQCEQQAISEQSSARDRCLTQEMLKLVAAQ